MAVAVRLTAPDSITTNNKLHLKVDRITYSINRLPSHLVLPGISTGSSAGRPRALIIDLGVAQEIITLEGVVDLIEETVSGSEIYPSLTILSDAINKWWHPMTGSQTQNSVNYVKLEIMLQGIPTITYRGTFKSANFVITGGQDDRAVFNIQFARRRQEDSDG